MDHVSVHGETIVPFTTDYMVNQFGAFAVKGARGLQITQVHLLA